MNILSLNIIGVGCEVKREWIKNIRIQNHTFLVGLQETKSMDVKGSLDKAIWGPNPCQCEVSNLQGLFGGSATLWNPEKKNF